MSGARHLLRHLLLRLALTGRLPWARMLPIYNRLGKT